VEDEVTKKQREIVSSKIRELRPLRGKRLIEVDLQPTIDGKGVVFSPVLVFEDGTELRFTVQEAEEWADGVTPYVASTN